MKKQLFIAISGLVAFGVLRPAFADTFVLPSNYDECVQQVYNFTLNDIMQLDTMEHQRDEIAALEVRLAEASRDQVQVSALNQRTLAEKNAQITAVGLDLDALEVRINRIGARRQSKAEARAALQQVRQKIKDLRILLGR